MEDGRGSAGARGLLDQAPLSDWLLRTFARTYRKGLLDRAAAELRVSLPTLRKGGPTRPSTQARVIRRLLDRIDGKALESDEIDRAFRARSKERIRKGLSNNFWFTFGNHEDPRVRVIAADLDNLETDLINAARSPEEVDALICRFAEDPAAVPRPATLEPAPERLSMNAMLMVLAAIDHASCWTAWQPTWRPRSLLLGMAPDTIDGIPRSPTRRFLDFLYPGALWSSKEMRGHRFTPPESPPTIDALEDVLGLHRADGKRSQIVHWRNGAKKLYFPDLESLLSSIFVDNAESAKQVLAYPYLFSAFWECVDSGAGEHLDWAKRRAGQWWTLLSTRDPSEGIPGHPYWDRI